MSRTEFYPHEIHVTVRINSEEQKQKFFDLCKEIGCKPVLIELQRKGLMVGEDVMTSDSLRCTTENAIALMQDTSAFFANHGFEIVREKVETVPWHPAAPQHEIEVTGDTYFESHVPVIVKDTDYAKNNRSILFEVCEKHNVHLSRNKFKQITEREYIVMCTLRSYDDYASRFERKVKDFAQELASVGFEVTKTTVEFAIYDSNNKHDDRWIKQSS